MNKTAIKNFAVWARRKLIDDITLKAQGFGITAEGIASKDPSSTAQVAFFNVGLPDLVELSGVTLTQRENLVRHIEGKAKETDLKTAFDSVMEEVAYTWFNRLIAIRFMEVNDYLPSGVRVLSSSTEGKTIPDMVSTPFDMEIDFTSSEEETINDFMDKAQHDDLFRYLFIRQCNALHEVLPKLFEKTNHYTELLLNISFVNVDGVVYHLTHDIVEKDFEEAVEIVGWLYQYYNTEPKDKVFADLKKNVKITKENIPAATQLFTPDWIVKYMVENSLGRLWLEQNPNSDLEEKWRYYLEEAPQTPEVTEKLIQVRKSHSVNLEEIRFLDPCMGSAHILVYAFDVFMEIYESQGYSQRESAENILRLNLFGLDIDPRAYQLAYFALMMKARSYDRRFFSRGISPMVYSPVHDVALQNFGSLYQVAELPPEPQEEDYQPMELLVRPLEERQQDWQFKWVLSQKYDIVCTNPPYMGGSNGNAKLADFMKKEFPDSKGDLFAVFMEHGNRLAKIGGYNCMVTMQSWMFLSSYEKMRLNILKTKTITNLMHMENMVMGIAFGTAVTILKNEVLTGFKGTYNHITYEDIGEHDIPTSFPVEGNRFAQVSSDNFSKIPGSPIAYWVSEMLLDSFKKETLKTIASPCIGMRTGDNARFLRIWYEVKYEIIGIKQSGSIAAMESKKKWFPYNKGGKFRRWYGNNDLLVNWENDGFEIKKETRKRYPMLKENLSWKISNENKYFLTSITWADITSSSFSGRFSNVGALFDVKGSSCFPPDEQIYYILGLLNTNVSQEIIKILNPTITTQVGDMARIPIIFSEPHKPTIDTLVEENISLSKTDWDSFETSWDFEKHPLITGNSLKTAYEAWETACQSRFDTLKANEEELNRIFIEIYGLEEELTPEVEDKDVTVRLAKLERDIKSLISYAVGCILGRYSLDCDGLAYGGGDWDSTKYQKLQPVADNCLVITEENWQDRDLTSRFIQFLKLVYGEDTLGENMDFIAQALGGKGTSREVITNYFMKDFFKDHVKTYQKRPIYWLYDSGKLNSFKALVYMHRYNADTTGKVRMDYLHKMQAVNSESQKSAEYEVEQGNGKAQKLLDKLKKQQVEMESYDHKIGHLANCRIEIDLDDGVKVNYDKVQCGNDGKKLEILGKI